MQFMLINTRIGIQMLIFLFVLSQTFNIIFQPFQNSLTTRIFFFFLKKK